MSFAAFNQIKQTTDNSCGAFALAAALVNLGRAKVPHRLNTADLKKSYDQPRPDLLALFIYQSTGNLLLDIAGGTAIYQYLEPVSNTNSPSALACKAFEFGTNPLYTYYNNQAEGIFSKVKVGNPGAGVDLLDTEINLINDSYGDANGPLEYTALPGVNEVHLLLVNDGGHWVAISNNEVYDPGTGYAGAYVPSALPLTSITYNNGAKKELTFTGIWIVMK